MEWRNTKKLGSLLGDYEDIRRSIQLSNNTMVSINKYGQIFINKTTHKSKTEDI